MSRFAWIVGVGAGSLILADTPAGPVVAMLLAAAIVYRGLQIQSKATTS
jgi:hypothetical protein